jgi:hypothetical protein
MSLVILFRLLIIAIHCGGKALSLRKLDSLDGSRDSLVGSGTFSR